MVYGDIWSVFSNREASFLEWVLSVDLEGCSLGGASKQSSSTFKEIAEVDGVSEFLFSISEHYEWQETAVLAFSLEIFHVSMEDVFKRLTLCWHEQKGSSHTGMTVPNCIFLLAGLENNQSLKLTSEQF